MRWPFFGDFFTACARWLHGIVPDNVISRIALAIQRPLKAGIPHDADPAVGAPVLLDQSSGKQDSVVYGAALLIELTLWNLGDRVNKWY